MKITRTLLSAEWHCFRGVANTIALSTGERLSLPGSLDVPDPRYRCAQRVLARKKSKRRLRALRRVARLPPVAPASAAHWQHGAAPRLLEIPRL